MQTQRQLTVNPQTKPTNYQSICLFGDIDRDNIDCLFQMTSVCVELGSAPGFCARLHWAGAGGDAVFPLMSQGHSYQRSSRLQHSQQTMTDEEFPVWEDIVVSPVTRSVLYWLLLFL